MRVGLKHMYKAKDAWTIVCHVFKTSILHAYREKKRDSALYSQVLDPFRGWTAFHEKNNAHLKNGTGKSLGMRLCAVSQRGLSRGYRNCIIRSADDNKFYMAYACLQKCKIVSLLTGHKYPVVQHLMQTWFFFSQIRSFI